MENTVMTLGQLNTTWVHHFGKPENKAVLKAFSTYKVKSIETLIGYYKWFISVIVNTPAWGVSGVNKKVNEITDSLMAHLTKAKSGKKSAYRLAGDMLSAIEYFYDQPATSTSWERVSLKPILTDEIIQQLIESTK